MTKSRLIRIGIACACGFVLAAVIAWYSVELDIQQAQERAQGTVFAASGANVGGPFELVDGAGQTRTHEDFDGKHLLIYFGYTFCPDICPTDVAQLGQVMDILGDDADGLQPIFISVDPERDTPEVVGNYVAAFHDDIVGLSGTPEQIRETARTFRVFYQRVEHPDFDYYLVDHSAFFYLMGPDGVNRSIYAHGTSPEDMAVSIRAHL